VRMKVRVVTESPTFLKVGVDWIERFTANGFSTIALPQP
jgi:hypothetical protein